MPEEQNPVPSPTEPNPTTPTVTPAMMTPETPVQSSVPESTIPAPSATTEPSTRVATTGPSVMGPIPTAATPTIETTPTTDVATSEIPMNNPSTPEPVMPASAPVEPTPAPTMNEAPAAATVESAATMPTTAIPENPVPVVATEPTPTSAIFEPAQPANLAGPSQEPPTPPDSVETSSASETGPSWLKQDPSESSATQPITTTPGLENAPPPWQAHNEGIEPTAPATNPVPAVAAESEETHGGFPVVIFVILVIAIIVAIGIFLFANNAIPGT